MDCHESGSAGEKRERVAGLGDNGGNGQRLRSRRVADGAFIIASTDSGFTDGTPAARTSAARTSADGAPERGVNGRPTR